jgi:hypothetical protein
MLSKDKEHNVDFKKDTGYKFLQINYLIAKTLHQEQLLVVTITPHK